MYVATRDELYLVPTAEVPVTNLHRDEILDGGRAAGPLRRLLARASGARLARRARTPAASSGSTSSTRSRWFSSSDPEASNDALEWMTGRAEDLLRRLGLAYRVLLMATRDMGFVQAKKYDLEVWAPGVERWLEVSSCSNFRDYQARRMAIRYRPAPGREARARPHAQRVRASPLPASSPRSSRPTSSRTAPSIVPEPLRGTLGTDVIRPR